MLNGGTVPLNTRVGGLVPLRSPEINKNAIYLCIYQIIGKI